MYAVVMAISGYAWYRHSKRRYFIYLYFIVMMATDCI